MHIVENRIVGVPGSIPTVVAIDLGAVQGIPKIANAVGSALVLFTSSDLEGGSEA